VEDRFDGPAEQAGDAEGWQAWVVAAGLQGIEGLPGDVELIGQGALAPAAFYGAGMLGWLTTGRFVEKR